MTWFHDQSRLPAHDIRRRFPERYNEKWFADEFCGGVQDNSKPVMSLVKTLQVCMPLVIFAAVPKICSRFFEMSPWDIQGTTHHVIGRSKKRPGLQLEKQ